MSVSKPRTKLLITAKTATKLALLENCYNLKQRKGYRFTEKKKQSKEEKIQEERYKMTPHVFLAFVQVISMIDLPFRIIFSFLVGLSLTKTLMK